MMKKIILYLLIASLYTCNKYSSEVNEVLKLAGDNKNELLKVLEHYKNDGDELKLNAAKFLISNLPYHYSQDTINLIEFNCVYNVVDSLKRVLPDEKLKIAVNKVWDSIKEKKSLNKIIHNPLVIEDIKVIKSDFLIKNIDYAFAAWQGNPYTKDSVSFSDFCEYILPYRVKNQKPLEFWREEFYNKNDVKRIFPSDITTVADSLLYNYKEFRWINNFLEDLPILTYKDLLKVGKGKCSNKTWLNSMLFSSQGFPIAVDYVSVWGNKISNGGHEWNTIIYGEKIFPFDAFWSKSERWNYKNIYNNIGIHNAQGKYRIPKVYRRTFSTHLDGLLADKRIKLENIPSTFLELKRIDVSDQYFKTVDVTLDLPKDKPADTYYAYLCVFDANRTIAPAQWGEIKSNQATFRKMGTDIVYILGFYKNGILTPAGNPFHLNAEGKITEFISNNKKITLKINRKYPISPQYEYKADMLQGAKIEGANNSDFSDSKMLLEIDFKPALRPYEFVLESKNKYKFVRIISKNPIILSELGFYAKNKMGDEAPISGALIASSNISDKGGFLYDNNYATPNFMKDILYENGVWLGIELEIPQMVTKISFCPRIKKNSIWKGLNYELFYWENGQFKTLGVKKAESYNLTYENVPDGSLYYLKCLDEGKDERIFTYQKGEVIWW